MASLLELQREFAAALRGASGGGAQGVPVRPARNLDIYRNNADWQFRNALALTFPVLRRRVGDEYFRQLAHQYRQRHPSRSGDLHWVGERFAEYLSCELGKGDYAWLADLARLEWACECAALESQDSAVGVEALAAVVPEDLERVMFQMQPGLRLGASPFPVVTIWRRNQVENAAPLDLPLPGEHYRVHPGPDGVAVVTLTSAEYTFLAALRDGRCLGEAMGAAEFDEQALLEALRQVFGAALVTGVALAPVTVSP